MNKYLPVIDDGHKLVRSEKGEDFLNLLSSGSKYVIVLASQGPGHDKFKNINKTVILTELDHFRAVT